MWDYFLYNSDTNKSVYQIMVKVSDSDTNLKLCGHSVTGKYPTNLKQHLKRAHLEQYKQVEKKESEQVVIVRRSNHMANRL